MKSISITEGRQAFGVIASIALAVAMMIPSTAFAVTAEEAANQDVNHAAATDNVGNTQYWLEIVEGKADGDGDGDESGLGDMSVDVPIKVTLAVDADGNFITPSAYKNVIENNSEFPLDLVGMDITAKNDFTLKAATGFDALNDKNIFNGIISSVELNDAGNAVESTNQTIGFTKLGEFSKNAAWVMEAADNTEKLGEDCLFVQIDGELGNVAGKYFTAPINLFDITYTFAAATADATAAAGDITD